jgi:hypothetical protein
MPQSLTRAFLPGQPLSPPAPIQQDLPPGGDPGQHLAKRTATNFDVEWVDPESGAELPPGGAIGEVLTKTGNLDGEADWRGLPPGLQFPEAPADGRVYGRQGDIADWSPIPDPPDLTDYVLKAGDTMIGPLEIDSPTSTRLLIVSGDLSPSIVVRSQANGGNLTFEEQGAQSWRVNATALGFWINHTSGGAEAAAVAIDDGRIANFLLPPRVPSDPLVDNDLGRKAYIDRLAMPPGGAIGNILVKRSAADRDAAWIPSYHNEWLFIFAFNILGVESVGDIKTFVVPADAFPNFPFDWVMQGSGYGTCYASNRGGNNPVSGSNWTLNLIDPDTGTPFNMGTFQWAATNPWTAANQLVKFSPSTPMTSRVWHYDPAVSDTITFQAVAGTANPPAANLTIGFQGMIVAI